MRYGTVTGLPQRISRLVLGTAVLSTDDRDQAFSLLDAYVESGGNAVDTAHIYGVNGSSELVVGQWLSRSGSRPGLTLVAKGACTTSCTPDLVTKELEESLDRLQTDYADIYLMHRDNPAVPAGEFVDVLNQELVRGRIRAFGGSNWRPARIEEANHYAAEHGLTGFGVSSPNFSLGAWNEAQWEDCYTAADLPARRWYESHDIALFAWSSQASGFFTGRYRRDDAGDPGAADVVRVWFNDGNFTRLERARELAGHKGLESTQIALAYVISQRFNAFALIGPHSVAELASSLRAADLTLTPEECAYLNLETALWRMPGPRPRMEASFSGIQSSLASIRTRASAAWARISSWSPARSSTSPRFRCSTAGTS
jgi:aryl-alcohol dehydrogenase-like predicted oxidoreductase